MASGRDFRRVWDAAGYLFRSEVGDYCVSMRGHVADVLYGDQARGAGGEGGGDDECDVGMMLGGMERAGAE